jgi:hypothetical protein
VAFTPAHVKVLSALLIGRLEVVEMGWADVVEPLMRACKDDDPIIAERARTCLVKLRNAAAIDELCAQWAQGRQKLLADAMKQAGYMAQFPIKVRVLSALLVGQLERVTLGGADVVEPLIGASKDADPIVTIRSQQVLRQLKNPEAIETLCQLVLDRDYPLAREVTVAAQYAPRDPQQRALFYFLTEQWEKYERLDFDRTMLQVAYEVGTVELRSRVAEKARKAGRVEWVEIATGGRQGRRLEEMTETEWETTLVVLSRQRHWQELWYLAQVAPAVWSVQFLRRLKAVAWVPEAEEECVGFAEVVGLAEGCGEKVPALHGLMHCRVTLKGHEEGRQGLDRVIRNGVSCLAISPTGQVLASGGGDMLALRSSRPSLTPCMLASTRGGSLRLTISLRP